MRVHSDTAWNIASKFSHVLASETRDLAAHIDIALAAERARCAKICDEGATKNDGDAAAVLMTAADLIRNPIELDS